MKAFSYLPPIGLFAAVALFLSIADASDAAQAVRLARTLPIAEGFAGSSINVVANRRHSLFTHGRDQFASFYDPDGRVIIAHRKIGSDEWRTHRTSFRGNTADAHNSISLIVDGEGFLHLAWDHHGGSLNYARSTRALAMSFGPKIPMTGRAEDRVTYPEFYLLSDGGLLCFYRDGSSGRGRLVLNRYFIREQRWETVQSNLIDGEGQRSPYWGATVDRNGGLHVAWIWRDTPDVSSNHDIAYAFSADAGRSWQSVEKHAYRVPFTATNSPYALHLAPHSNLMNSPWVAADERGRPYISSYWAAQEGEAPQFHVLRHDGKDWRTEHITERSQKFTLAGTATRRPPISRGVFLVEGGDENPPAHLIYRDDERGGRALRRSTPRLGSGEWTERELTHDSLGAWEPTIDPVQWERWRQLHLLLQSVTQRDGEDAAAERQSTPVSLLIASPREDRESQDPRGSE